MSIGRPIANTQIYILDSAEEPVPIGVSGEIWIGGAGVAIEYHRRPELTAQRFVPDRFSSRSGARLYRTGDVGRWGADGRLYHLGRLDEQVKIRGHRIELGEIEAALREHPAVQACVVVVRASNPGDHRLVGYIATANTASVLVDELRTMLKAKLPAYMIPSTIVSLPSLPLTANGKIDRLALPAPEALAAGAGHASALPVTETQQALAAIWEEILGIKQVGIHADFFDLGGSSLLIIRMINEVRRRLGITLSGGEVLQNPTIDVLARLIEQRPAKKREPRVMQLQTGSHQQPVYFIHAGPDEFRLAQLMGQGHAIFGIEVPWPMAWRHAVVERQASALPDIEELIAPYIEALRAHQHSPSCVLAGHSFAGIIAFEVARKIQNHGGRVAAVILFDTRSKVPSFSEVLFIFDESIERGVQSIVEFACISRAGRLCQNVIDARLAGFAVSHEKGVFRQHAEAWTEAEAAHHHS